MQPLDHLRRWWQLRTGQQETPFDEDVAAWLVSLVVHAAILVSLATLTLLLPADQRLILSATSLEPPEPLPPEEFRFAERQHDDLGALSAAGDTSSSATAPLASTEPEIVVDIEPTDHLAEIVALEMDEPLLVAPDISDQVALKGEGSVGTTGAAGAIDRITNQILLSLDQRPTLVVWLFDQSGSLAPQREEIVSRFDRVYDELGVLEAAGNPAFQRHKDKPLLTSVAAFGADAELLTPRPTDDLTEIKSAVRAVTNDPSGVENVFSAVTYVARKLRSYRLGRPRRNVMIVVFTDEAGDDTELIDSAIDVCTTLQMPVFVVGVPAPFGRRDAYVRYVDPDPNFDQRTQWVPVHQGPESLLPERLRLSFAGQRPDQGMLDSGFGPFGLVRLTYETGGVYFAVHPNRSVGRGVRPYQTSVMSAYVSRFFDPAVMRAYRPDYVSLAQYRQLARENRARAALLQAAQLSWTSPMQNPRRVFANVDEAEFARELTRAQQSAAALEPIVGRIVATLREGEPDRHRLVRPRWQAGFDLALGRALALQVRTVGYNTMLATAKRGLNFTKDNSDTWRLRSSPEISTGSALEKSAAEATGYLRRVVNEHEGTPWAMIAQRELAIPLGWKWQEEFRNVRRRREMIAANNMNAPPEDDTIRPPDRPLRKPPAL